MNSFTQVRSVLAHASQLFHLDIEFHVLCICLVGTRVCSTESSHCRCLVGPTAHRRPWSFAHLSRLSAVLRALVEFPETLRVTREGAAKCLAVFLSDVDGMEHFEVLSMVRTVAWVVGNFA